MHMACTTRLADATHEPAEHNDEYPYKTSYRQVSVKHMSNICKSHSLISKSDLLGSSMSLTASRAAILWDVDGTLVESTALAFNATNEVLTANGHETVSVEKYKEGCRYTTPERFNFHIGVAEGSAEGARLGAMFDETYVARVSKQTAGLFPGLKELLCSLHEAGHPQAALSNACGAYVRAVMDANELSDVPGKRLGLMRVALGADEVPAAKPAADGLLQCCAALGVEAAASVYVGDSPSDGKAARAAGMRAVGVLWGANEEPALRDHFDVLCLDVPSLMRTLQELAGSVYSQCGAL